MIVPCTCEHKEQDRLHGRGRRVHNMCSKSSKPGSLQEARCTVCGKVKTVRAE